MSKKASKKHLNSNGESRKRRLKPPCGPLDSTATADNGAAGGKARIETPAPPAIDRFLALLQGMDGRVVTESEISELSELVVTNPDIWGVADLGSLVGIMALKKTHKGAHQAVLKARANILEKQLAGKDSTALELLVIEQIVISWIRLQLAEGYYNSNVVGVSASIRIVMHWDQFLANAQRRHLAAVETLARIRRLGRIGPAVQLNIAQSGSQQMNVQGVAQFATTTQNGLR